eukprot:scaffold1141_cov333-Pavlova_lutheri.AAC.8
MDVGLTLMLRMRPERSYASWNGPGLHHLLQKTGGSTVLEEGQLHLRQGPGAECPLQLTLCLCGHNGTDEGPHTATCHDTWKEAPLQEGMDYPQVERSKGTAAAQYKRCSPMSVPRLRKELQLFIRRDIWQGMVRQILELHLHFFNIISNGFWYSDPACLVDGFMFQPLAEQLFVVQLILFCSSWSSQSIQGRRSLGPRLELDGLSHFPLEFLPRPHHLQHSPEPSGRFQRDTTNRIGGCAPEDESHARFPRRANQHGRGSPGSLDGLHEDRFRPVHAVLDHEQAQLPCSGHLSPCTHELPASAGGAMSSHVFHHFVSSGFQGRRLPRLRVLSFHASTTCPWWDADAPRHRNKPLLKRVWRRDGSAHRRLRNVSMSDPRGIVPLRSSRQFLGKHDRWLEAEHVVSMQGSSPRRPCQRLPSGHD